MRFADLEPARSRPRRIEDTSYGVAWANDNATVFYIRVDAAMRPYQLWRHRVGTDPASDALVYEEPDERFYLGVGRTKDGRYVLMDLHSKVTSEVQVAPRRRPDGDFSGHRAPPPGDRVQRRPRPGRPRAGTSRFLIVTNDGAENFRLMAAPDATSRRGATGRRSSPHRPGVRLDGVDPFAEHLVVYERRRGRARIRVIDATTGSLADARSTGPSRRRRVVGRSQPRVRLDRRSATSTPRWSRPARSTTSTSTTRRRPSCASASRCSGDFDPGRYRTERRWAVADDGTEVPISLVYRPDLVDPGPGRHRHRASSTATAPTRTPSTRSSRRCG